MTIARHNNRFRIVLAAGGTGGHVFPAEALAQELTAQGHEIVLMTDHRGAAYGGPLGAVNTVHVEAAPIAGRTVASRIKAVIALTKGFFQARHSLKDMQPDVVVGFGGYATVPTMLAAIHLGMRTVIHEQNAVLGRANRLVAARVKRICLSLDLERPAVKTETIRTGMPVRAAIAEIRGIPYAPPTSDGPIRILVLGGSQGAWVFSAVVPAAVARLPEDLRRRFEIAQQCRPEDMDRVNQTYGGLGALVELRHFFDNVPELMSKAHLLITRSGASTVAEAAVAGRPAILVPYPYAADDHQSANARAFQAAGAGWTVPNASFTPEDLAANLSELARSPKLLTNAAAAAAAFSIPDAAHRLADVVTSLVRGKNGARQSSASASLRPTTIEPGAV